VNGTLTETSWTAALDAVARAMRESAGSVAVLGGARGTNEDAFMWARLADAVGSTMTDAQLDDGLPASVFGLPQATIDSACASSTVVLLAPDLKEELPVLHIRLRDAAAHRGVRIIEVASHESGLTAHAWKSVLCEPGTQQDVVRSLLSDPTVRAQVGSGPVTVVAGRPNLAESASFTVAAVHEVLSAAPSARVLPVLRRGNVRGALSVGLAPRAGNDAAAILDAASHGKVGCLVLLGADPLTDVPDAGLARRAVSGARFVVAVDTFLSGSAQQADVVLPAAAFGEKEGTTTNLEGRVSNVVQKITPRGTSRADWMVAAELMRLLGQDSGVTTLAQVQQMMSSSLGSFGAAVVSPDARRNGVLASSPPAPPAPAGAGAVPRNSYDFRLVVSRRLYDGAAGTANSPSLAGLAPGASVTLHPLDAERIGASEGSTVTVSASGQGVRLPVLCSGAVPRGVALVPFNQPGDDIRSLVSRGSDVTDVRIEAK
jgi:NADH-quinone oxidoreductase subunit G